MDFDSMVLSRMVDGGLSVGAACDRIQAMNPAVYDAWKKDRGQWKTVSAWRTWAQNMVAKATEQRKGGTVVKVPTFSRVVALYQREGLSRSDAIRKAVLIFPESHQHFIQGGQNMVEFTPLAPSRKTDDGGLQLTGTVAFFDKAPKQHSAGGFSAMNQHSTGHGQATTFEQLVGQLIRSGETRSKAIALAARQRPDLHEDFLRRSQTEKTFVPSGR